MDTVVIIGAGIGGLAAAVALDRAGVEVSVHERAPRIEEVGAGIGLWPNAILALDELGIGPAIRATAGPVVDATLRTPNGRILQSFPGQAIADRYGGPFVSIHRAELQSALAEAFGAERIHTGHELASCQADAGGVRAMFVEGGEVEGTVLVGADGIRSVVRSCMFRDGPARYRGDTSWRAVTTPPPGLAADEMAFETFGRGLRFGATPIGGGRVQWFAGDVCPAGELDGPDPQGELLARFGSWHDPIPQLIESTTAAIIRTDLHDRPRVRRLAVGRVALLGDAAHMMGPDLAQGACQAIEDAVELGRAFAAQPDRPVLALAAYEAARLRRVRRVARLVSAIGVLGRTQRAAPVWLRDRVSSLLPAPFAWRQLDSVIGLPRRGPLPVMPARHS